MPVPATPVPRPQPIEEPPIFRPAIEHAVPDTLPGGSAQTEPAKTPAPVSEPAKTEPAKKPPAKPSAPPFKADENAVVPVPAAPKKAE